MRMAVWDKKARGACAALRGASRARPGGSIFADPPEDLLEQAYSEVDPTG